MLLKWPQNSCLQVDSPPIHTSIVPAERKGQHKICACMVDFPSQSLQTPISWFTCLFPQLQLFYRLEEPKRECMGTHRSQASCRAPAAHRSLTRCQLLSLCFLYLRTHCYLKIPLPGSNFKELIILDARLWLWENKSTRWLPRSHFPLISLPVVSWKAR